MKKILFYFCVTSLTLLLSACTKKTSDPTEGGNIAVKLTEMTFTCSSDGDGSLKTSINNNGKIIWTAGDKIRVYTDAGDPKGYSLTLTSGAGTSTGTFQGVCPDEGPYYAMYPDWFMNDSEAAEVPFEDGKVWVLTFPLGYEDKYMDKSFDTQSKNAYFVSYSEDNKLHFTSVFGYLAIPIYGTGEISKIRLTSNNGESLGLLARVSAKNPDDIEIIEEHSLTTRNMEPMKNQPNMTLTDDVEQCITPVFVIPSGKLSEGFTLDFYNKDGHIVEGALVRTNKNQTIQRGVMRTMEPIRVVIDDKPTSCGGVTPNRQVDAIEDGSGNKYDIVQIGEQWWMADDLITLKYSDGTAIESVDNITGEIDPNNPQPFYNNKLAGHVLYTWSAAMRLTQAEVEAITDENQYKNRQGVCPNGWHIPSIDDYDELVSFLRCSGYAGLYLKANSTAWGDYPGFDCYGFGAMPCMAVQIGRGEIDFRATPITDGDVSYLLSNGVYGSYAIIDFNKNAQDIRINSGVITPIRCIKD